MERLYVPLCDMSNPDAIIGDISFIDSLMSSLVPSDINYASDLAFYGNQIDTLSTRLSQLHANPPPQQIPSPAMASPMDWTDADTQRKRPRELSSTNFEYAPQPRQQPPQTPVPSHHGLPGAWPAESSNKRPRQNYPPTGGNMISNSSNAFDLADFDFTDLTGTGHQLFLQQPMMTQNLADPFQELQHMYQPVQAQSMPTDAFLNDAMELDDLAQFLMQPTPPGGLYPINQFTSFQPNQIGRSGPAPRPLNLTIPNARIGNGMYPRPMFSPSPSPTAQPDVVNAIIEGIKCQDELRREPTPAAMSSTLMEHQKQALAWLMDKEKSQYRGSILADEMGLGKTVEGLSLILANPSKDPRRKTTLIVAPVALMRQWEKELERHVHPSQRLSVYTYHRSGQRVDFETLRKYDVVLTTFGTLAHEFKRIESRKEAEAKDRERRDPQQRRAAKDRLGLLGDNCLWYRIILDEAQCIKNRRTLTSRAACDLRADLRLCMTGTPMQNSIEDLYPLIRFLRIKPYSTWNVFNESLLRQVKKGSAILSEDPAMPRLQALIKSFTLRRLKTTEIDGKPICDLPPKHVERTVVDFTDPERELYKAIETQSQLNFNMYLKKGTVTNNYANILVMLLRLRQLCCHPHLVQDLGVQVSTDGISESDLKSRAEMLDASVVRRLKEVDGFECPICFETEINPTIIIPCGHTCCGECFQKLIDPASISRNDGDNTAPKCPHCRGTLSSDLITDYRHFCKVFCPEKFEELRKTLTADLAARLDDSQTEEEEDDDDEDSSDEEDEANDNDSTLGGFIVDDEVDDDADENDDDDMNNGGNFVSDDSEAPVSVVVAESSRTQSRPKKKGKGKGKGKAKAEVEKKLTLAQLKAMSLRNVAARKKYFKRLRKGYKPSAKIDKTMDLLRSIRENDPTEKVLIFSSFTTLLDLLEVPLSQEKYKYQRYDGSMKFDDRVEAVNEFMDRADENILLISIKAGNAGLNLNKASQVIMLDPFWNPFVEDQAVDRAHRMPQKREVHVHRVLVPETVEDRICALQDQKREMINTALDENAGNSFTKLSVNELRRLFGS